MNIRAAAISAILICAVPFGGCAVTRDQQTVGQYVDDATITARIKASFVQNDGVDAVAITVETLKGVVALSGFAKNSEERQRAEVLARGVTGVSEVRNNIIVR